MSLDVYLQGKRIGTLIRTDGSDYSFAYAPEAVEDLSAHGIPLSHSLPIRAEPFSPAISRAYVEGLLPQGARRRAIARELDIRADDGYELIAALGGDCLGAVSFGANPVAADAGPPVWLTDAELEELLQPRPERLFDHRDPRGMRFTLPGERHKLALVHDERCDRWALPCPGAPSTHIVKPEAPERPGLVANEHACTIAYRELGIPVAHTSVRTIAGQRCLISKRFDRWGEGPAAERLHQESFAQALGIAPDAGGRLSTGTPGLGEVAGLLRTIGEGSAIHTLMRTVSCDLLVGCTELRGGNAGLLFGSDGPMLAPLYGIASTEVYDEVRPRPIVIGIDVPPAPLLIDIRHAVDLCDVEFQPALIEAVQMMGELCSALNAVADDALAEGWHDAAVEGALEVVIERVKEFQHESVFLRPRDA